MKPVMQTKFGMPEGNCFAACLASLLELPIEEIPEFSEKRWFTEATNWLFSRGLAIVHIDLLEQGMPFHICPANVYYIASGKSPRGIEHSVIYQGNRFVHDPHPDGTGIEKVNSLMFLIPRNPMTEAERKKLKGR